MLIMVRFQIPPADYSREITGTRTEQRVKMNRMRLKIAARLKEAQNTNAMLTTFNEIDMRSVNMKCQLIRVPVTPTNVFFDFVAPLWNSERRI